MTEFFSFVVKTRDGSARTGAIATPRGIVRTPSFMPVGTGATVKAMFPEDVAASGADILLANTYHLMLRPGAERIAKLGGLHGRSERGLEILHQVFVVGRATHVPSSASRSCVSARRT